MGRLRSVAAIPPTSLAEPIRRLAYRTPPHVILIRITRITGDPGREAMSFADAIIGWCQPLVTKATTAYAA